MPTYEYVCKTCHEHLEVVQSFMDQPLTECPRCGGELRKVFSPIGISFKGSGFYKTDSRAGASRSKAQGDGAGEKAGVEGKGGEKAASRPTGEGKGGAKAAEGTRGEGRGGGAKPEAKSA
jgi:putative FmdB family regulatory protein